MARALCGGPANFVGRAFCSLLCLTFAQPASLLLGICSLQLSLTGSWTSNWPRLNFKTTCASGILCKRQYSYAFILLSNCFAFAGAASHVPGSAGYSFVRQFCATIFNARNLFQLKHLTRALGRKRIQQREIPTLILNEDIYGRKIRRFGESANFLLQ